MPAAFASAFHWRARDHCSAASCTCRTGGVVMHGLFFEPSRVDPVDHARRARKRPVCPPRRECMLPRSLVPGKHLPFSTRELRTVSSHTPA